MTTARRAPSTGSEPGDIAERLHWRLFRLTASFRRRDYDQIAEGGLTLTQCSLLYTLREKGPMRLTDIAAFDKVAAPTVGQAVRRLEGQGLVQRVRDATDQRVQRIAITPRGVQLQRAAVAGLLEAMVTALSPTEIAKLEQALEPLDRINRAFEPPADTKIALPSADTWLDGVGVDRGRAGAARSRRGAPASTVRRNHRG